MATNFGVWQPSTPGGSAIMGRPDAPQMWTNTQTGQQVYGTFDGISGIKLIDQSTGQPTGYHAWVNGQTHHDESFMGQLGHALPKLAAVVGGGLGLGALTAGSAGAGAAGAADAGADASMPAIDTISSAGTPAMAGTAAGAGSIPGAAAAIAPSVSGGVSSVLPNIAKLATGGVGLGLTLASRNQASQANQPLMDALNTLLPSLQARYNQTTPLFGNVVNMAHGMLPKAYQ